MGWLALCCMCRAMCECPRFINSGRVRRSAGVPLLIALSLSAAQLRAQPSAPSTGEPSTLTTVSVPSVPSMTLQEALAYARLHQPELRSARERFLAVAADARVPAAQWLPTAGATVEVVGSTANNSTATIFSNDAVDLPRIGGTPIQSRPDWHPYATTLAAVGLRQELFDFGRIAAQTAAGEALIAIERDRLQATHLDITFFVTQAYYAVKAARAVMDGGLFKKRQSGEGGRLPPTSD